jgi:hypothetical protein
MKSVIVAVSIESGTCEEIPAVGGAFRNAKLFLWLVEVQYGDAVLSTI